MTRTLFNIKLQSYSKKLILEKIQTCIKKQEYFFHIVSLNPEIIVEAKNNSKFLQALQNSQEMIIDGVGVYFLAKLKGLKDIDRITGVDLMQDILAHLSGQSIRVMFLGGEYLVAEKLAQCYKKIYPAGVFMGEQGIKDIHSSNIKSETNNILDKVVEFRPHIIFASFGSPFQELWFWENRDKLKGVVCMGVGGAFDFIVGNVARAPKLIRILGLEWLYRLILQPWRWRRQLKLIKFVQLGAKELLK
jgi:N-acetylglucosaminyldiphosphoundecaprenol N-acetyl-beta-D-mannosaminyltransferase